MLKLNFKVIVPDAYADNFKARLGEVAIFTLISRHSGMPLLHKMLTTHK